jgi:hypothetical protein
MILTIVGDYGINGHVLLAAAAAAAEVEIEVEVAMLDILVQQDQVAQQVLADLLVLLDVVQLVLVDLAVHKD